MAATFLWFSNLAIAEKPPASARRTDGFRRRAASSQTSSDRPTDSRAAHRLWICCTSTNQNRENSQHLICFFRFPKCTREQHPGSGKAGHSCYTINGLNHFLREWGGRGIPTNPRSPMWSHPKMQGKKKIPSVSSSSSHLIFLTPLHHSLPTQTMTSFGCFVAIYKLFICFCFFKSTFLCPYSLL